MRVVVTADGLPAALVRAACLLSVVDGAWVVEVVAAGYAAGLAFHVLRGISGWQIR